MKESTHHLQKRVCLLEDHNRTLLEFSQDCAKRLQKLETQNGWELPKVDFAAMLGACVAALRPVKECVTSAEHAAHDDEEYEDEQEANGTTPRCAAAGHDGSLAGEDSSSVRDSPNSTSKMDHSTAVKYIYQMYKARSRDLYADVNAKLSEMCSWDAGACKFKARAGRPRDAPSFICTSAEDADKVVAVIKHFTAQHDALRLQHQHEQLAFLQARYAQEYPIRTT